MSETDSDEPLDDVLIGEDYQEQLRRIAAASESSTSKRRKTLDGVEEGGEVPVPRSTVIPTLYEVRTPSGATLPVLTEQEVEYYEERTERYTNDHRFTSITDLQDLDRVLSHELMLYRYDIWLALSQDYWGNAVSEKDLLRYMKELSNTLQALKKSMGLDKATRDKDQGADFVGWLEDVRRRAKEFMIMRNEQFFASITLMHEVLGKVQTYMNTDAIEREELGLHPEQVLDWLWQDVRPRFEEIDRKFLEEGSGGVQAQRYWTEG